MVAFDQRYWGCARRGRGSGGDVGIMRGLYPVETIGHMRACMGDGWSIDASAGMLYYVWAIVMSAGGVWPQLLLLISQALYDFAVADVFITRPCRGGDGTHFGVGDW